MLVVVIIEVVVVVVVVVVEVLEVVEVGHCHPQASFASSKKRPPGHDLINHELEDYKIVI